MSLRNKNIEPKTPGAMADYLIATIGLGLLIIYYQQPDPASVWGPELSIVYLLMSAALVLWGLYGPLSNRFPFLKLGSSHPGKRSISWGGIILTLIGLEFIHWSIYQTIKYIPPWLLAALGGYLVIWGIKEILQKQIPSLRFAKSQQRVRLPQPGIVYLLIMFVMLGGSLLGRSNMLMLVFSLMAGPFILNGWITYSMLKKLSITRELPAQVMAGDPLIVHVTLQNGKFWFSSWLMSVTDYISNQKEDLNAKLLFVRIPRRSEQTGHYEIRLMQRGRYEFGPLQLSTRFPLGLTERGIEFRMEGHVIVLPRIGKLTNAWHRDSQTATELVERQQQRRSTFDDEFHSIREYRLGDNPRAIHWRTSARQNELMVREYRQSRDYNLVVLLDLWMPESYDELAAQRVELAISFAATICVARMKGGGNATIRLAAAGRTLSRWRGQASPGNVEPLLKTLAEIEASHQADLNGLVQAALASRAPGTKLMLITTRLHNPNSESVDTVDEICHQQLGNEVTLIKADAEHLSHYFII